MYIPTAFAESDTTKLHDFIEQHSFGLLVSQVDDAPFATHLPFLLDRTGNTLTCHVARANPHWQHVAGQSVLAIFSGPHVYVSPTWYQSEQVVPTWNYAAVHVYGRAQVVEDEDALRKIVQEMVRVYEQSMPKPWSFDGSTTYAKRMLAQIVGIRITIERIEGKFKLNQNQPEERRYKVANALERRSDENSQAIAELMRAMLAKD